MSSTTTTKKLTVSNGGVLMFTDSRTRGKPELFIGSAADEKKASSPLGIVEFGKPEIQKKIIAVPSQISSTAELKAIKEMGDTPIVFTNTFQQPVILYDSVAPAELFLNAAKDAKWTQIIAKGEHKSTDDLEVVRFPQKGKSKTKGVFDFNVWMLRAVGLPQYFLFQEPRYYRFLQKKKEEPVSTVAKNTTGEAKCAAESTAVAAVISIVVSPPPPPTSVDTDTQSVVSAVDSKSSHKRQADELAEATTTTSPNKKLKPSDKLVTDVRSAAKSALLSAPVASEKKSWKPTTLSRPRVSVAATAAIAVSAHSQSGEMEGKQIAELNETVRSKEEQIKRLNEEVVNAKQAASGTVADMEKLKADIAALTARLTAAEEAADQAATEAEGKLKLAREAHDKTVETLGTTQNELIAARAHAKELAAKGIVDADDQEELRLLKEKLGSEEKEHDKAKNEIRELEQILKEKLGELKTTAEKQARLQQELDTKTEGEREEKERAQKEASVQVARIAELEALVSKNKQSVTIANGATFDRIGFAFQSPKLLDAFKAIYEAVAATTGPDADASRKAAESIED